MSGKVAVLKIETRGYAYEQRRLFTDFLDTGRGLNRSDTVEFPVATQATKEISSGSLDKKGKRCSKGTKRKTGSRALRRGTRRVLHSAGVSVQPEKKRGAKTKQKYSGGMRSPRFPMTAEKEEIERQPKSRKNDRIDDAGVP